MDRVLKLPLVVWADGERLSAFPRSVNFSGFVVFGRLFVCSFGYIVISVPFIQFLLLGQGTSVFYLKTYPICPKTDKARTELPASSCPALLHHYILNYQRWLPPTT